MKRTAGTGCLILLLLGACEPSHGGECTLIGCGQTGFIVRLDPEGGTFPSAEYQVDVLADDTFVTSYCDLSNSPHQNCTFASRIVAPGVDVGFEPVGPDDLPAIYFRQSADNNIVGVSLIEIDIQRDGTSLASASYAPEYVRDEPNGPGCGFCDHAPDETLVVALP